ncbi:NLR family CARD domain-containing protein 3 isoform X1 [Astyanax mexicanus]|uniref:NLR family CARD domain-containing protein 3 isoform X1 n=1 Tax=Astyanax mexicanus TaxID=7994 RepID=UPI0020CAF062|nr:NLR family CARD domain-containing protein 3 isoform X1 [Astyanax mexicanus]XP_049338553.1 NLR family CARD domain-containing protein 3 isoform X1 [Astyanax mexicanus]
MEPPGFSSSEGQSSCVSMKSDRSLPEPPGFSSGKGQSSCVSMKSDRSLPEPPGFSSGKGQSSCVSMKSDRSLPEPPGFSSKGGSSCGSMKSDRSLPEPPGFSSKGEFCCVSIKRERKLSDLDQCSSEAVLQPQNTDLLVEGDRYLQKTQKDRQMVVERHKTSMKKKYESLFEGIKTKENRTLLNRIYTQLYIIEGESEGVNEEHEVLKMEKTQRKHLQDTPINLPDIFKPLQALDEETKKENSEAGMAEGLKGNEKPNDKEPNVPDLRTVLTKGIAGIGKTVSVQKFVLDWAEGTANQDVDFMFVLPFRELSLIKDKQCSLHELLCVFYPELRDLDPKIYKEHKAVFIFDGLDESRITMNFSICEKVADITTISSVGVLMTNLIKGDLLASDQIWLTSRPAAANQIPPQYINRVMEIQGFSDPQKEEYFKKRIRDQVQVQKIISHIKNVRSLHIMCHIPVFCWISATVLQRFIKQHHTEIPKTLTEMYIHFLLTQTNMKNEKYDEKCERDPKKQMESNRSMLLKLAELAFKQLMNGNVMFYEEDLTEISIDVTEAVNCGVFTEIFREECVIYQRKVYSFVHLSFQEFLAAVYVFHCYECKNMEELQMFLHCGHHDDTSPSMIQKYRTLSKKVSLDELLKDAVDKAQMSQNGHLDLFLRFLLGISVKCNQRLLRGLLTCKHTSSKKVTRHIKIVIQSDHISSERSINLFLCLSEMHDQSLSKEIEEYLKSKKGKKLSPGQCSVLTCMLLISEEVLEELDLKNYNTSVQGYRRLIPAVTVCRKALLVGCDISMDSCGTLGLVLQSENCLKELDLSNNDLQDSGVELLSAGLKSSHCKLQILRLSGCMVTEKGCYSLASALHLNPFHLRELDLAYNHPGESGMKLITDLLKDPHYKLDTFRMEHGGEIRIKPGLRKYVCDLLLDPNTANSWLLLTEGNRKVMRVWKEQSYPDHPERFDYYKQVLCTSGLTGRCYWEAEWVGTGAGIAVTYRGIPRKGDDNDCMFGCTKQSWCLYCHNGKYSLWHNYKRTSLPAPRFTSHSVGVYLDWAGGILSFYSISPKTLMMIHLHTIHTTFTEPLYAGVLVIDNSPVQLNAWDTTGF